MSAAIATGAANVSQLRGTKCSRWLTPCDLARVCDASVTGLDGIAADDGDGCNPLPQSDDERARVTMVLEAITIAESHAYHATGCQWPGACVSAWRPCVESCRCRARCSCICDLDELVLPVSHPIIECEPDGLGGTREILSRYIAPGEPLPLIWGHDTGLWRAGTHFDVADDCAVYPMALEDDCWRARRWPAQVANRPLGAPCTWAVEVATGGFPPADVLNATAELACEELKRMKNLPECQLPYNVKRNNGLEAFGPDDIRRGWDAGRFLTGITSVDQVFMRHAEHAGYPKTNQHLPDGRRVVWQAVRGVR